MSSNSYQIIMNKKDIFVANPQNNIDVVQKNNINVAQKKNINIVQKAESNVVYDKNLKIFVVTEVVVYKFTHMHILKYIISIIKIPQLNIILPNTHILCNTDTDYINAVAGIKKYIGAAIKRINKNNPISPSSLENSRKILCGYRPLIESESCPVK